VDYGDFVKLLNGRREISLVGGRLLSIKEWGRGRRLTLWLEGGE